MWSCVVWQKCQTLWEEVLVSACLAAVVWKKVCLEGRKAMYIVHLPGDDSRIEMASLLCFHFLFWQTPIFRSRFLRLKVCVQKARVSLFFSVVVLWSCLYFLLVCSLFKIASHQRIVRNWLTSLCGSNTITSELIDQRVGRQRCKELDQGQCGLSAH